MWLKLRMQNGPEALVNMDTGTRLSDFSDQHGSCTRIIFPSGESILVDSEFKLLCDVLTTTKIEQPTTPVVVRRKPRVPHVTRHKSYDTPKGDF